MKQFKCSMRKKIERLGKKQEAISGKNLMDPEQFEKDIREMIDGEYEKILKGCDDKERQYYEMAWQIWDDCGYDYAGELYKKLQQQMYEYVSGNDYRMSGNFANIQWDWDDDHKDGIKFADLRKKLLDGVNDADTDEFSTWAIDWFFHAFGTYNMCYNFANDLGEEAATLEQEDEEERERENSDESKKRFCSMSKKAEKFKDRVTLYTTTRFDEATVVKEFLEDISGGNVAVAADRRGGDSIYVYVSPLDGDEDAFEAFIAIYADNFKDFTDKCDVDLMGWTDPVDLKYFKSESKKSEATYNPKEKADEMELDYLSGVSDFYDGIKPYGFDLDEYDYWGTGKDGVYYRTIWLMNGKRKSGPNTNHIVKIGYDTNKNEPFVKIDQYTLNNVQDLLTVIADNFAKKTMESLAKKNSAPQVKKSEGIGDRIMMGIDYNMFMRMCKTAAYLEEDEDYWDALWEFYSEMGEIEDALVFFDNLFQYTAWKDVDETYDELKDEYKDESNTKEDCIEKAIDEGALDGVYPYGDHYLWIY